MVAPGILLNPSVRNWLGGIVPAWTLLDQASFEALGRPPSSRASAITLALDLSPDEIGQSAVARNTLILLHAVSAGPGLNLTAAGNLTRGVVAEMIDLFTWPGLDKADAFRFLKVINEPDFLPLYFVRRVADAIRLVRRYKGHLKITSVGRRVLEDPGRQALPAHLFHIVMWRIDLDYLGRGLHEGWPQGDIGVLLWSLSVSANDWQSSNRLTRLCTIPINGVLENDWDSGTTVMEARVLRPLWWFGLLEYRREEIPGRRFEASHLYRKTPLFDRLLSFDIKLETAAGSRH